MDDCNLLTYNVLEQKKYGLDVAIYIEEFRKIFTSDQWEHRRHEHGGDLWISLSEENIRNILPFWSQTQIDKVTRSVMKHKIMKKKRIYSISHGVCFAFVKKSEKE